MSTLDLPQDLAEGALTWVKSLKTIQENLRAAEVLYGPESTHFQQYATQLQDFENALIPWLAATLRAGGWPDPLVLGPAAASAWLTLVASATHFPKLQLSWLRLLRQAVTVAKARPKDLAFLEDRVRLSHLHRGQLYATQLISKAGVWHLEPVEDPAGLPARRISVGLPPLRAVWDELIQQDQLTDERVPEFIPPSEPINDLSPPRP